MSNLFQKYKFILIIGAALFCALLYDYCSNAKERQTASIKSVTAGRIIEEINPIELENPIDVMLGKIEGTINATELFSEFSKNERKARVKFLGKTFRIKGQIIELFKIKHFSNYSGAPYFTSLGNPSDLTAGIMLLAETQENINQLAQRGIDSTENSQYLPYMRKVGQFNTYSKDFRDFSHYSDDFSYESEFEGIYCMFSELFDRNYEENTKVEIICKVRDYKKGGIEKIMPKKYSLAPNQEEFITKHGEEISVITKARVILIGCLKAK